MINRALFLDRDGVINHSLIRNSKPYAPIHLKEFSFIEGVKEALNLSKKLGFLNIIVTNQPDISTGKQSLPNLNCIHEFIKGNLLIDDIFVCLHSEDDQCLCRKPLPGMLHAAAEKWNLNLKKSYLIGDRWRDTGAAQAAECPCFFIDYGYKEQQPVLPYMTVASLKEAVQRIYELEEKKQ